MITSIRDYKRKTSEEAKFVYTLDKLMPVIINILSEGGAWRKHKVTIEQLIAEKERKIPANSPLYAYYQELLAILRKTPHYFYQEK